MRQHNRFREDMLDLEEPEAAGDVVYIAAAATSARVEGGVAVLTLPLVARKPSSFEADPSVAPLTAALRLQSFGGCMVRAALELSATGTAAPLQDLDSSPMIERDPLLQTEQLVVQPGLQAGEYLVKDLAGRVVFRTLPPRPPSHPWSRLIPDPDPVFDAVVVPDGASEVPFMAHDTFFPAHRESIALGCVVRNGTPRLSLFSLHARPGDISSGRVSVSPDSGWPAPRSCWRTPTLLGFPHGGHTRTYRSTCPAQVTGCSFIPRPKPSVVRRHFLPGRPGQRGIGFPGLVLHRWRLLFGSIVHDSRRLTGVPRRPPMWSYGAWMARMTYFSAKEALGVAQGMGRGSHPCDVIHLDTGSVSRRTGAANGSSAPRGSLTLKDCFAKCGIWDLGSVSDNSLVTEGTSLYSMAREKGMYSGTVPPLESKFDDARGCTIDFTNPAAVEWYKGLLRRLLRMGAAAIKTDFGESIDMQAAYHGMSAARLRNIYCLLYHRAAFEVTREVYPDGIIWARSAWAGSQRYPVHWGGDAACTWDGLAATIRGGLQIGLSGFAFWSHDVPGFHSLPSFMNDRPSDELFVRWTQVGVFTSHLRFHGSSAREPWEYPAVADLVREWLKLRYALIPYLLREADESVSTGMPMFRSLVFHHEEDPIVWTIEDEFYCGGSFLVAPILNAAGVRSVYLPAGERIDFWSASASKAR